VCEQDDFFAEVDAVVVVAVVVVRGKQLGKKRTTKLHLKFKTSILCSTGRSKSRCSRNKSRCSRNRSRRSRSKSRCSRNVVGIGVNAVGVP